MSLIVRIDFLGKRYHATPWGRHVNEGVAEWPPSPWRLLRGLVAVWRRTHPDMPEADVRRLLGELAAPPLFRLPRHSFAHSRHYMPWEKKGPQDRTLVFDSFVSVDGREPLLIHWPHANLDAGATHLLAKLLRNLNVLGRAESWVEASLREGVDVSSIPWNCVPSRQGDIDPIPVFCADPETCFGDEHYPRLDLKRWRTGKVKPAEYLFDCPRWHLCLDTETLHAESWPAMPGGKWVNYRRVPFEAEPEASRSRRHVRPPTVARLLLDGPVLPLLTDTLSVGEAARRAAMGRFGQWCRRHPEAGGEYRRPGTVDTYASPLLSGKDGEGARLPGPGHVHYWPLPTPADSRRIGSLTLFARAGLGPAEVAALASLRTLRVGDLEELRLQLIGLGQAGDLEPELVGPSRIWRSATPFLGHSEIGLHGRSRFLRKGLRREWRRLSAQVLDYMGIELQEIVELAPEEAARLGLPQPREFGRARRKDGGREAYRAAGLFRLVFSQALRGPLALGYANHFGMGRFVAEA